MDDTKKKLTKDRQDNLVIKEILNSLGVDICFQVEARAQDLRDDLYVVKNKFEELEKKLPHLMSDKKISKEFFNLYNMALYILNKAYEYEAVVYELKRLLNN